MFFAHYYGTLSYLLRHLLFHVCTWPLLQEESPENKGTQKFVAKFDEKDGVLKKWWHEDLLPSL